jgi:acyl-CoA synthetase (AMP-forming)/AMP-acid ligase II
MTIPSIKPRYDVSHLPPESTLWQLAEASAAQNPGLVTHLFEDERCRVGDLVNEARTLSAALQARGYVAGDVVAFQLPNWREALIVDLACVRLGLVVAPIVPIYREAEIGFMLGDCGARGIFVPGVHRGHDYVAMLANLQAKLPGLRDIFPVRAEVEGHASYARLVGSVTAVDAVPCVDPDSIKMVLYTSGTTGRPKGVLHSHNSRARGIRRIYRLWEQREADVMLMTSPVTHITGFGSGLELPFLTGLRSVIMERWNAPRGVELIERERATVSIGATPFLRELLDAAEKAGTRLPTLRRYACGGAAVPPALIRRAWTQLANCRAFRVYGSSEIPLMTVGFFGTYQIDRAAETDGQVGAYEVRIVDDHGREVLTGAEGEICARGAAMFVGYLDAKQTQESFDVDGFFHTGDIGCKHHDGAIEVTDRKKDLINRGGEKISAREVEDILHRHPAIAEAAIIAVPHPRMGESACACVVLRGGHTLDLDGLTRHVAGAGVARQKLPERLEIVPDLPKTPSGKVRKDALRVRFARGVSLQ